MSERTDRERIRWLEDLARLGGCPGLICDDNGHWALSTTGTQEMVSGMGPHNLNTSFFVAAAEWKNSIRDAIDAAIEMDTDTS